MIRLLLPIICLAISASAFAQSATDFAEASSNADAQSEKESIAEYASSWADFNNQHRLDERDGCYFKAEGELTQILEIDGSGRVVGYYADKDNGRSQCWRNTYLGVVFPKPPFAPFWHRLVMH